MRRPVNWKNQMLTERHRLTVIFAATLMVFVISGCGGESVTSGSICEPDRSNIREKCRVQPNGDGSTSIPEIDTRADVRDFCAEPCRVVEQMSITNVNGLEDLQAFSTIEKVVGDYEHGHGELVINGNPDLESLEGTGLTGEINGILKVSGNGQLDSLAGLEGTSLSDLEVTSNSSLNEIGSLAGVNRIESIEFRANSIETLKPLNEVEFIRNPDVPEDDVRSALKVRREDVTTLNGFEKMESVDWLLIDNNPNLKSLDGLENLNSVDASLMVQNNESLPSCLVTRFVDRVATAETNVEIYGNTGDQSRCPK